MSLSYRGKTWLQAVSIEHDTHNGDPPLFRPLSAMRIQIFAPFATTNGAQQWISLSSSSPLFLPVV